MSWQYNGCAKWTDITDWCDNCLEDDWYTNGSETIYFISGPAYTLFLLRWN